MLQGPSSGAGVPKQDGEGKDQAQPDTREAQGNYRGPGEGITAELPHQQWRMMPRGDSPEPNEPNSSAIQEDSGHAEVGEQAMP